MSRGQLQPEWEKDHSLETCSARLFRSTDDPIGSISKHGFGSCSESRLGDLRIRHKCSAIIICLRFGYILQRTCSGG